MKISKYTLLIGIVLLVLIGSEGIKTIRYINDNKTLRETYQKYEKLTKEIDKYEAIKNNLSLINNKNSSIQIKIKEANEQINSLNKELGDYRNKIATLNRELSK